MTRKCGFPSKSGGVPLDADPTVPLSFQNCSYQSAPIVKTFMPMHYYIIILSLLQTIPLPSLSPSHCLPSRSAYSPALSYRPLLSTETRKSAICLCLGYLTNTLTSISIHSPFKWRGFTWYTAHFLIHVSVAKMGVQADSVTQLLWALLFCMLAFFLAYSKEGCWIPGSWCFSLKGAFLASPQ